MELREDLSKTVSVNMVAVNAKGPMCSMHGSCTKDAYSWERWIAPMYAVNITVLQDTSKVNYWQQVGGGLMLHDDYVVYDRCGRLFLHICAAMSCRQMGRQTPPQNDIRRVDGYHALRTAVLLAAQHSAHGCPCAFGRTHQTLNGESGRAKQTLTGGTGSGNQTMVATEKLNVAGDRGLERSVILVFVALLASVVGCCLGAIVWGTLAGRRSHRDQFETKADPTCYGAPE